MTPITSVLWKQMWKTPEKLSGKFTSNYMRKRIRDNNFNCSDNNDDIPVNGYKSNKFNKKI